MNRALLKQDAKDAMRMATPSPILVTLAYIAVSLAASMILGVISVITGNESGNAGFIGILVYLVVTILISLLLGTIQFGYYVYSLKVFKQEETGIGELFSYFPMMLKIFGLSLWIGLFTLLWSCLCYIPGIIAALRYSQAFYVLAENPDKGIRECVNESKELMRGRLWEYFVLELSFILWILLVCVTCGIAGLYVSPYMNVTMAGYYLSLKPVDDTYGPADDRMNSGYAQSASDAQSEFTSYTDYSQN
ncbi:MAG: DUF975 family protein [Lachnospiraceae bacterium]|nr:DUF975 family protein [Lachnospiraceae bacterium]